MFARVLGGLLDVALHPRFAREPHRLSELLEGAARTTSRRRRSRAATSTARRSKDVKDIFVANTWSKSNTNYGGRIAFDRAGLLYLTVGERQEQERAQKPGDHGGKVLRLRDDGSVPPDNPFVGQAGISAGDLLARPPQPAGAGDESGDRRDSGRTSTARSAATSSTSSSRGRTTAGRS